MDAGQKQTDKLLKDMSEELDKIYAQALKEIQAKLDDYMRRFKIKDEIKRKALKQGKITEAEYKQWRLGQIMIGKRWEEMETVLATDLTNANRIAASMINDHIPDAYAIGSNYAAFEVEAGSMLNTSFTLYDRHTVERLVKENPKLLPKARVNIPKDLRWNKQKLNSAITQGVLQGENLDKVSRRLQYVTDMNRHSAVRNARTMMTSAENGGRFNSYLRAEDLGISMEKQWMATLDGRTRHSHAAQDGEHVPIREEFSNGLMFPADPDGDPREIYNCFVGDTLVATDSDIVRSYKHEYKGELVTIETAAGVKFTCTLNHPILTPSGWVRANRLNKGDDICVTFVGDHHLPRRYPNVNHIHSRIDALHEFANKFGRERVSGLRVNFHGDVPATDVEVITHKGLLRDNRNAGEFEEKRKLGFKFSNSTLFSHGTLMKHLRRVGTSAFCFVCGACEALSFFLRGLRHSEIHRLRPIALLDASGMKPMKNNLSGYAEFFRKRLHGASTVVFADNIISVNYSTDCTHVYNLQSDSGYYFVNSIISKNGGMYNGIGAIVHNCRCTMVAVVGETDPTVNPGEVYRDSRLEDIDYEDWLEEHMEEM